MLSECIKYIELQGEFGTNWVNPFHANGHFLYLLKTSENHFLMFSGSIEKYHCHGKVLMFSGGRERVHWERMG